MGAREKGRALRNLTITVDAKTAGWARVHAAQRNMSMSRFIAELLEQHMRESREYEDAMRKYFSRGPFKELSGPAEQYPSRDELHDRARLR
jgi:hypothetical protein